MPSKQKNSKNFEIDGVLFKNRQTFLSGSIDDESATTLIKELYALDSVNNKPIVIYLNTPGGSCCDGLAIINTMHTIKSPVITIITNEVCSMGCHISINGDKRYCYKNSVWMAHDIFSCMDDYSGKLRDRAVYLEKYYKIHEDNLKMRTKLSPKELQKARDGELWLFADEMKEKGIVDGIINYE